MRGCSESRSVAKVGVRRTISMIERVSEVQKLALVSCRNLLLPWIRDVVKAQCVAVKVSYAAMSWTRAYVLLVSFEVSQASTFD